MHGLSCTKYTVCIVGCVEGWGCRDIARNYNRGKEKMTGGLTNSALVPGWWTQACLFRTACLCVWWKQVWGYLSWTRVNCKCILLYTYYILYKGNYGRLNMSERVNRALIACDSQWNAMRWRAIPSILYYNIYVWYYYWDRFMPRNNSHNCNRDQRTFFAHTELLTVG